MAIILAPILAAITSLFAKEGMSLLAGAVKGGGEKAVKFIEEKTGIDIKDIADPNTETQLSPEQVTVLKTLESTERIELAKMGYADVDSARKREVEVTKATGKSNTAMYALATVVVVGFFVLMVCLIAIPLPTENKEVSFIMFGGLLTAFGQVCQYFFGSSKGSADKTQMMGKK